MSDDAPSESDLVAIAAHLHVQLRRRTGRVIDVEWIVANAEYANAIVSLAKASATTEGAPELAVWATRFERALLRVQRPRKPLLAALAISSAAEMERQSLPSQKTSMHPEVEQDSGLVSEFGDSHRVIDTSAIPDRPNKGERYVWGLR